MNTKLVWVTPDAEKLIAYMARVSNPANQDNENIAGLLKYCAKNGHWSIFEMASMCVEITTSRDISAQLIRHRSFSFQEFSQRYAENTTIEVTHPRRQDTTNRQNSIDDLDDDTLLLFNEYQRYIHAQAMSAYNTLISHGVAKECARRLLPMSTQTKLYMTGNLRSWMHYFKLRCDVATQLEHREVANSIRNIFNEQFPIMGELI